MLLFAHMAILETLPEKRSVDGGHRIISQPESRRPAIPHARFLFSEICHSQRSFPVPIFIDRDAFDTAEAVHELINDRGEGTEFLEVCSVFQGTLGAIPSANQREDFNRSGTATVAQQWTKCQRSVGTTAEARGANAST